MTLTPNDVFLVSPSTTLEIAEGLMGTLNTIIKHLPEPELRRMRDTLELSLYAADDLLLNVILSSDLDTLSINGASTTPSSISTATTSAAATADGPAPSSLPASVAADCGVVTKPVVSYDDEIPTPAPTDQTYSIILSSRPNVGCPDYSLHPPFIRPGVPGPYEKPPVDPSKGDPVAYHVVTKGLYIGIFTSWVQCSPWVTKVAGNTHFKVFHWAGAKELYNSCLAAGACEVLS